MISSYFSLFLLECKQIEQSTLKNFYYPEIVRFVCVIFTKESLLFFRTLLRLSKQNELYRHQMSQKLKKNIEDNILKNLL